MNVKRKPWAAFAREAHPIIADYVDHHGRSPYSSYLRRHGLGWIDSAATKHYGGYHRVLRRLGFTPAPRPLLHLAGCRPHGYWADDRHVLNELQAAFPDLLAWNTMPSIHMIQSKLPGLGSRILKTETIRSMSRRLGLALYWDGLRARRRVEGIDFVLTFYETHGRWPHASECSSDVRGTRFVGRSSWHDYCRARGLPDPALQRLIVRVKQHIDVLEQLRKPGKAFARRRVLNWLIEDRSKRFPLLP